MKGNGLLLLFLLLTVVAFFLIFFAESYQIKYNPTLSDKVQSFGLLFAGLTLFYGALQYGENQKEKAERTRPFVIVTPKIRDWVELEITNTGATPAKNISMKFTPDIPLGMYKNKKPSQLKIFTKIPYLSTNAKLQVLFGAFWDLEKETKEHNTDILKINIEYNDISGKLWYTSEIELDFEVYSHVLYDKTESDTIKAGLDKISHSIDRYYEREDMRYRFMKKPSAS